ncbi:unnamed protein product [Protopolystoma xenopodis]|uniref:Uncharacterized protein n=1 Tax=Protopolystoma xenopodis TaxID=117903 RepID=A0A3S5B4W2_9PLAT|nr:unnamed protein product [Protopolystoma xenopodis]
MNRLTPGVTVVEKSSVSQIRVRWKDRLRAANSRTQDARRALQPTRCTVNVDSTVELPNNDGFGSHQFFHGKGLIEPGLSGGKCNRLISNSFSNLSGEITAVHECANPEETRETKGSKFRLKMCNNLLSRLYLGKSTSNLVSLAGNRQSHFMQNESNAPGHPLCDSYTRLCPRQCDYKLDDHPLRQQISPPCKPGYLGLGSYIPSGEFFAKPGAAMNEPEATQKMSTSTGHPASCEAGERDPVMKMPNKSDNRKKRQKKEFTKWRLSSSLADLANQGTSHKQGNSSPIQNHNVRAMLNLPILSGTTSSVDTSAHSGATKEVKIRTKSQAISRLEKEYKDNRIANLSGKNIRQASSPSCEDTFTNTTVMKEDSSQILSPFRLAQNEAIITSSNPVNPEPESLSVFKITKESEAVEYKQEVVNTPLNDAAAELSTDFFRPSFHSGNSNENYCQSVDIAKGYLAEKDLNSDSLLEKESINPLDSVSDSYAAAKRREADCDDISRMAASTIQEEIRFCPSNELQLNYLEKAKLCDTLQPQNIGQNASRDNIVSVFQLLERPIASVEKWNIPSLDDKVKSPTSFVGHKLMPYDCHDQLIEAVSQDNLLKTCRGVGQCNIPPLLISERDHVPARSGPYIVSIAAKSIPEN